MPGSRFFLWLVGAIFVFSATAWSAQPDARQERSQQPITVTADHLKADGKDKTAVFSGRVVARQQDVTIYSDRLEVYYGEESDEVDKVVATGNVRIVQTDRVGTGGHAVYETKQGRITLSDKPRVTKGNDTVSGATIVYYVDEERSVVEGGSGRVEAVLHPKSGSFSGKTEDGKKK